MKKKKILVRSVLVLVALAALCACAWCVWYIVQYYQGQAFGDRMRTNISDDGGSFQLGRVKIPVDFDELQTMNPDIYAWLKIPDTDISYAVLQRGAEDDQEYYSKHSENGAYYSGGSIFSQSYNRKDFSDPMTVLYGHNLRNGRMFAQLNSFSDAEVFESHRYIYVYLPDRMLVYEIFAAYPHSSEHLLLCHDFADAEDFTAYFDDVRAQKSLQANVREDAWPQPGDRVLTLSTCYRGDNHQRYLVQGKLVAEAYAYNLHTKYEKPAEPTLGRLWRPDRSAVQAVFLTLHVFDDDIVDVAETGAVFEHLPGRVRVEMDLDEVLVAHGEQTVARDVGEDVVVDRVLVEVVAFDEQLGVKTEFEHGEPP